MLGSVAFGWRYLLFANWPVETDRLADHLPPALAVDEYDGSGWLSVIPLVNVDVRPAGLPSWLGFRLPELNVRTYVTCNGEPGIYFFSLDAQGLLGTVAPRLTHYLPYYYARGRADVTDDRVTFESRRFQPGDRPGHVSATYGPTGDRFTATPGSRAEFLTERRRLFTQAPSGALRHTEVDHERWPLYSATATLHENTILRANGFATPDADPVLYYSPGVDVVTSSSRPWWPAM